MNREHLREYSHDRQSQNYNILPLHIHTLHDYNGTFLASHHWHDEMEIIYVEKGEIVIQTGGVSHRAKENEVYFINSQDIHQISAGSDISIHHAIVFNPEILRFVWYDPFGQEYIDQLIKGNIKYLFHTNDFPKVKDTILKEIKDALEIYQTANSNWPIMLKASLLKIIATLISHELLVHTVLPENKGNEKAIIAKTIMNYIHENYKNKITLEQLANHVNFSVQYFCKFFKSIFGRTAIEYINEYRLEKACQLLVQTNDKIIDIAFSVGFDNFSYFIHKFKSLKGITPSTYRHNNDKE